MWSKLGCFVGIGRVLLSREGGNGAYCCNREGENVPLVVVFVWKLWVRGGFCLALSLVCIPAAGLAR